LTFADQARGTLTMIVPAVAGSNGPTQED